MRYFSSPGSLRRPMDSDGDDPKGPGFPIRKSTDQSSFAAPHGLSQRTTSFIASRCQGIHQTPLRRLIDPTSNGQRPMTRLLRYVIISRSPGHGTSSAFCYPVSTTGQSTGPPPDPSARRVRRILLWTGLARSSRYSPCPTATTDNRGMPPPTVSRQKRSLSFPRSSSASP